MSVETAILACLYVPAIGSLLIWLTGSRPNLRESVTLATAGILFCLVLVVVIPVAGGARPEAVLIEMFPGL
ncbi:MAG: monovalent cation/H+ antiporter subunit D family protein, partial [Geminicoccaceae bacterium]